MLLFYSASSFASLGYPSAHKVYEQADVVFIGNLKQMEVDSKFNESAILNNVFTIKGEPTPEIRLCNEPDPPHGLSNEGLNVGVVKHAGANNHVYFFKKKDGCHVGALGYKSIIYIKTNTNCIFAEFAYPHEEEYKNKLEPLELFVKKLVGDKSMVSFPESLKTEKCEWTEPPSRNPGPGCVDTR